MTNPVVATKPVVATQPIVITIPIVAPTTMLSRPIVNPRVRHLCKLLPKLNTSPRVARNFPRFQDLSPEMRFKIWEHAAKNPREITLRIHVKLETPPSDAATPLKPIQRDFTNSRVPAVLHVSYEARFVALKSYTLVYEKAEHSPEYLSKRYYRRPNKKSRQRYMAKLEELKRGVYVNFAVDTFVSTQMTWGYFSRNDDSPKLKDYHFGLDTLHQIQHFESRYKTLRRVDTWIDWNLLACQNMKTFTVSSSDNGPIYEDTLDHHLNLLKFKDAYTKVVELSLSKKEVHVELNCNVVRFPEIEMDPVAVGTTIGDCDNTGMRLHSKPFVLTQPGGWEYSVVKDVPKLPAKGVKKAKSRLVFLNVAVFEYYRDLILNFDRRAAEALSK